ncbi:MAG TPA: condensation domain-containing protein [Blastocatellia bacterium]|nr:condensation domain-containing protein [Blastocatellia bacterium]
MNPKQIEEFFHLSPLQKHLLRQSELSAPTAHLAQFTCELVGPLDASAFERAWQKVTNRQPALRTTFVSGDLKEPVQVVNRNVSVALEKHDWRNLAEEDQARHWEELLQSDRQTSFVLKTPPLWHMTLIRMQEEQHRFVWTYHELLFDERSLPLLFNEALEHYSAILQGKTLSLPLPVSWRKYVEWHKKQDNTVTEQFWRTYLKGFHAATTLPLTLPETTVQLAAEKAETLQALAAQQSIAPEVIAYGAWALLLSRLSGQTDVVFGVQVSGRASRFAGAERLIGHLRNTVPLRVRIVPDAMVVEWLTELHKQWEELQHYAQASLSQIQDWSESDTPLLTSVVVFEGTPCTETSTEVELRREIAGLQIQDDRLLTPNHFHLAVMINPRAAWELTGDVHVVQLRSLLEQFAIMPQRRLAELILPTEAVRKTTVATAPEVDKGFAPASSTLPPATPQDWKEPEEAEQGWVDWLKNDACVHELFEERAERTPDEVAVQWQGQSLTYRELNARANQLAHYLRKLNIAPSLPVGLCFAPCLESAVGLLGILKAGGAYLPLDASLSQEEVQTIIAESATTVVLTQARLEPKFRLAPLHCIVLCLDSDWMLVAEEETANPICWVSDEHPACFLSATHNADLPAVITHAQLAQTVAALPVWFSFTSENPWHLFQTLSPDPVSEPTEMPEPENLNGLNGRLGWFDLTPVTMLDDAWTAEPNPTSPSDSVSESVLEVEAALETPPEAIAEEELELDVPLPAPPVAPVASDQASETISAPSNLSPIQQWFLAQRPAQPHHWNVSLLAECGERLEPATLRQALELLLARHDNLRGHFVQSESGWYWEAAATALELPFEYVDFSARWPRSQRKAIEETADKWQTSLHLSDGPLWRAGYFDLGADRSHRLLIIAHQLIADETSLRIFLDDWLTAYWQLHRGQTLALPPVTASYQEWVQALATAAEPAAEPLLPDSPTPTWPVDHPTGTNRYGQVEQGFVSLNSKETENLLQYVLTAAEADLNEIVLTAITLAVMQWANSSEVSLELERDLRPLSVRSLGVDVTRTMGWFAAKLPVWLAVERTTDSAAALQAVKAQLRARETWWNSHGTSAIFRQDMSPPLISFKPLTFSSEETTWQVAPELVGVEHHPDNERNVLIAVTGAMNLHMLEFRWEYAREQFEQKNIGLLVNGFISELRRIIQYYSQHNAQSGG